MCVCIYLPTVSCCKCMANFVALVNPICIDSDMIMDMSNFSNDIPLILCCVKYRGSHIDVCTCY